MTVPVKIEMSTSVTVWRDKAFAAFPALQNDIYDADYSIYSLFFDLLPVLVTAHRERDVEAQDRIYDFAEWCFFQDSKELWNAAGVAFYEHLFDEQDHWEEIVTRLPLQIMEECWTLWNARLSLMKLRRLRVLCKTRFPEFHPTIDLVAASGIWTVAYQLLPTAWFRAIIRFKRRAGSA